MSATGRTEPAGFTLLEMLVVLAIMGLIAGIGFPAIERVQAAADFRRAEGLALRGLHAARAQAILTGQMRGAVIEPLPGGAVLHPSNSGILFYADGSSSGAELTLTLGKHQRRVVVDRVTGQITGQP